MVCRDWSQYADKTAASAAGFGVEGNQQNVPPALPVSAFWDLVPDSTGLFGKVLRYNGGPSLNPASTTQPGRIAIHIEVFPKPLTNVWVRQYVRFSPNWTTGGTNPAGGSSYKTMFLHWQGAGFRMGFLHNGNRERVLEYGQDFTNDGSPDGSSSPLPWATAGKWPTCVDYGRGIHDAWPTMQAGPIHCIAGQTDLGGPGNGEWFEVILHSKQVTTTASEGTLAIRQYTVNGKVQPGPWDIQARRQDNPAHAWAPASDYQMGVNRNKAFDAPMFIWWATITVVDGSANADPFGLGVSQ